MVVRYGKGKVWYKKVLAAKWEVDQIKYEGEWWDWKDGKKVKTRVEELLDGKL